MKATLMLTHTAGAYDGSRVHYFACANIFCWHLLLCLLSAAVHHQGVMMAALTALVRQSISW